MKVLSILLTLTLLFTNTLAVAAGPESNAPASAPPATANKADAQTKPDSGKGDSQSNQNAADNKKQEVPNTTTVQPTNGFGAAILIALSYIFVLGAIARIASMLISTQTPVWNLNAALSEEVEFTSTDGNGVKTTKTEMVASSSRVIALFGLIVLLVLFMGMGSIAMWHFATTGEMPDFGGIMNFFYAGAGLFVPYGLNQFKAAFEAFGPKH